MNIRAVSAAVFLFLSGMSALIYQVAWMREFRLVFGATTSASAAVMAIFMGGLGLGGVVLGRRADCSLHPLRLYAKLLLLISVAGAASPFLIDVSRHIYIALGGESALGTTGAIVVRLGLAGLVLGLPTFWMGGTVPAVVKAIATAEDRHRRIVGVLYGVNTLGAVLGAVLSTFVALEVLGTRWTLWLACLVNLAVAGAAKVISTRYPIRDL